MLNCSEVTEYEFRKQTFCTVDECCKMNKDIVTVGVII